MLFQRVVRKMKRPCLMLVLAGLLAGGMAGISVKTVTAEAETTFPEPILYYDFEDEESTKAATDKVGNNHATLSGRVKYEYNEAIGSTVLNLRGQKGYLEFPQGFFDYRDTMTISMDIYSKMGTENFFTLAIGKDSTQYLFLRTRSNEIRYAITKDSYGAEDDVATQTGYKAQWVNITLVLDEDKMTLYIDGECVDEQDNLRTIISDFGSDVIGYIGKSFYDGDSYLSALIDNVRIYDVALTGSQIAVMSGAELTPFYDVTGEGIITWKADKENKVLTVYAAKTANAPEDQVVVSFKSQDYAVLDGADIVVPYGEETEVAFRIDTGFEQYTESWTVTSVLCGNPVLSGQYADPDIDVFGDTYYLYTTTDGFSGWSGTVFHCFSSKNLVDWTDEGVILNVAKGGDVAWSTGSAWAPTIEEKGGKYYFYFCAKDETGESMIGVAVADHPAGPYTAMEEPLMTVAMCRENGVSMGQAIDPSIFTDDDGTSYMLFGNGAAAVVKLNEDMVSCDLSTLENYYGVEEFREAITVVKRNGVYHFTWSCDDTGSPNYHVNYGTSDSIYGPIEFKYTVLSKDADSDILGTGHHSMLQIPGEDEYYIAYHRFYTPIGFFSDGTGHHRQTCIDKVTFGEDGLMEVVTPTLVGVAERTLPEVAVPTEIPTVTPTPMPETEPTKTPNVPSAGSDSTTVISVTVAVIVVAAGIAAIVIAGAAVAALKRKKK